MQRVNRKTGVVMKIAKQCYGEAIQPLRPAGQGKIPAHNLRTVRFEQHRIAGNRYRSRGAENKPPSCDVRDRQTDFAALDSLLFEADANFKL
jgi:hypothetical protein